MIGYKSRENSAFVVLELLSWDPKIKIHVEKTKGIRDECDRMYETHQMCRQNLLKKREID